ncbi:MAG: rRNA (cytosine1962-C5)-methyltransferase, partial [Actinomycetota bacterium]
VAGGHKTGFYLDQRNARTVIAGLAAGRRVLNVFSYTGAFSVVAAAGGAESILSIDSSGPALEVAARNASLNGVDIGEQMEADAFTALRGLRDRARQYDLIMLDPPKLAANDKQVEKASRAYKDLNLLAVKLLAPGGTLLTFSCSGAMSTELFQKVVAGAALDANRTVRIVGRLAQPSDHPVPLSFPEAEYLKGLVLVAELPPRASGPPRGSAPLRCRSSWGCHSWTSSIRVPKLPFGWMKATVVPRLPGRGALSMGVAPAATMASSASWQLATR